MNAGDTGFSERLRLIDQDGVGGREGEVPSGTTFIPLPALPSKGDRSSPPWFDHPFFPMIVAMP